MSAHGPPVEEIGTEFQSAREIDAASLWEAGGSDPADLWELEALMHCERVVARSIFEWDHRRVERIYADRDGRLLVQSRYYLHGELQHVHETVAGEYSAALVLEQYDMDRANPSHVVGARFEAAVDCSRPLHLRLRDARQRLLDRARTVLRALAGGERA